MPHGSEAARRLVLYSRSWCHLCDEMIAALAPLLQEFALELDIVDIDADPELERLYNEQVPLLAHDGREIARWRLDAGALRAYLARIG